MAEMADAQLNYFAMMVHGYLAVPFAGSNPAAAHLTNLFMKLLERLMYHPNLIKRTFFVLWAGGFIPIAGITVVLWLVSQFR